MYHDVSLSEGVGVHWGRKGRGGRRVRGGRRAGMYGGRGMRAECNKKGMPVFPGFASRNARAACLYDRAAWGRKGEGGRRGVECLATHFNTFVGEGKGNHGGICHSCRCVCRNVRCSRLTGRGSGDVWGMHLWGKDASDLDEKQCFEGGGGFVMMYFYSFPNNVLAIGENHFLTIF